MRLLLKILCLLALVAIGFAIAANVQASRNADKLAQIERAVADAKVMQQILDDKLHLCLIKNASLSK